MSSADLAHLGYTDVSGHSCSCYHIVKSGSTLGQVQGNSRLRGRGQKGSSWPRLGITPGVQETDWYNDRGQALTPCIGSSQTKGTGVKDREERLS